MFYVNAGCYSKMVVTDSRSKTTCNVESVPYEDQGQERDGTDKVYMFNLNVKVTRNGVTSSKELDILFRALEHPVNEGVDNSPAAEPYPLSNEESFPDIEITLKIDARRVPINDTLSGPVYEISIEIIPNKRPFNFNEISQLRACHCSIDSFLKSVGYSEGEHVVLDDYEMKLCERLAEVDRTLDSVLCSEQYKRGTSETDGNINND